MSVTSYGSGDGHLGAMSDDLLRDIGESIVLYIGWGQCTHPTIDFGRVVERFGAVKAEQLRPLLERLVDEFFESTAMQVADSLVEMRAMASGEFRRRHPELAEDAVQALGWYYAYSHK